MKFLCAFSGVNVSGGESQAKTAVKPMTSACLQTSDRWCPFL